MIMYVRTIVLTACALVGLGQVPSIAEDNDAVIKNATSAAPKVVGENATVVTFDDKMQMKTLKKGTNGFTCMADDPTTPSNDPMCADENGLAWALALMHKEKAPPAGKIGFGYMLQGETAASNVDPFAAPPADGKWHEAGPHVMIFNAKETMAGYSRPGEKPDVKQPWVMWAGSPYEHLMIPVPGD